MVWQCLTGNKWYLMIQGVSCSFLCFKKVFFYNKKFLQTLKKNSSLGYLQIPTQLNKTNPIYIFIFHFSHHLTLST